MKSETANACLIQDASLLRSAAVVGERRGDRTVSKTVRDLLRERLTEIQLNGDPLAPGAKSMAAST